ncbi:MAG TPA: MHYT domain-containing protein [Bryobacteraceae bacterium]|nr:MHYT domain-containing protein [Bryobacteraceae bacterium]
MMNATGPVLPGHYDWRLVTLSFVIAIVASYAALNLAGRVKAYRGRSRLAWISGGAATMGFGIWSMHYIGMIAYVLPVKVLYDVPTVVLSLVPAFLASGIALYFGSRDSLGPGRTLIGGALMGSGIGSMHYVGMDAMRLDGMCHYSIPVVGLSVVNAVVLSMVAMRLTVHTRNDGAGYHLRKVGAAILMGHAIALMHYTGMAAVTFTAMKMPDSPRYAIEVSAISGICICMMALMALGLAILTAIVDRRLSAKSLENESLAAAVAQAAEGVVVTDVTGTIEYVNASFSKMTGYTAAEALGHHTRMLKCPETESSVFGELWSTITQGQTWKGVLKNQRKDGSAYWEQMTIAPVRDRAGAVTRYIALKQDITERKKYEAELVAAREGADTANRAKSIFLANMSHEIRTPMNGVLGMLQLLGQTKLESQQARYVTLAQSSAQALLNLINDILDLSKIESRKITIEYFDFNLKDIVDEVMQLLLQQASTKGVELGWNLASDVPQLVRGDAYRIRQVLTNLAGNAIKFTERGSVKLKVTLENVTDQQCHAVFTIKDTGIGISPEKLNLLFSPFVQADSSTTRKYGGTGLGLAVCKELVALMGGSVSVESVEGSGSTFSFSVKLEAASVVPAPKIEPVMRAEPESAHATKARNRAVRILVAEDNPTNQEVILGQLELLGYSAIAVVDGQAAIDALRRENFDLVLMDCDMPRMDGLEATRQIRSSDYREIPIVALTASAMAEDRSRCVVAGMSDYMAKPVDLRALRAMLAKWLNGSTSAVKDQMVREAQPASTEVFDAEDLLMRLEGDDLFAKKVVKRFVEDFPAQLTNLKKHVAKMDGNGVRSQAHALKGSSATVGARAICTTATALEKAGAAGELEECSALAPRMAEEFERFKNGLELTGWL